MIRAHFIALMALVLAACACAPVAPLVLAGAKAPMELAPDLECMVDCLQDGTETCEECGERCLSSGPSATSARSSSAGDRPSPS